MASTNSTQSRSTGIGGAWVGAGAGSTVARAAPANDGGAKGANRTTLANAGVAGFGAYPSGLSNLFGSLLGIYRPPPADPFIESGRRGTAVWGGYVQNIEKDPKLYGQNRYRLASDMLSNVSIVAAGLRFFLNLVAVPAWSVKPAEDLGHGKSSPEAQQLAEFVQDVLDDMTTSWTAIVRRSGMFRFHGFGIQEWVAKRREDGHIGIADVEQRPQHTIERWELADDGTIIGMWQRWPQNGQLLFLPRPKVIYLVDDLMTDSPEGLGLFRHLVDPSERIRRYLKMEGLGYERDMRGLPVGRAPLAEIQKRVISGLMTQEEANKAIYAMRRFVEMQVKEEDSALLTDSETYIGPNADGFTVSQVYKWGVELLKGGSNEGFQEIGKAIDRLTHDMARIIGVETLLLGSQGQGGSRALSEDKSRNLYLSINGTVKDIAEGFRRDMIGPVWAMNGLDPKLMPKLHTEDVAFKDVAAVAKSLSDMATAGAILAPDDPAINDVRDLLGVSKQPAGIGEMAASVALIPRVQPPKGGALAPGGTAAPPEAGGVVENPRVGGSGGRGPARQVDPSASGGPHEPGPTPAAPGSPQHPGRRNRTSNSTPGA